MKIAISLLLPFLVAAGPLRPGSINHEDAPIVSSVDAKTIPNNYIIVFKKHVTSKKADAHRSWLKNTHDQAHNVRLELRKRSGEPEDVIDYSGLKHTFSIGELLGYTGHFDENTIEMVRKHDDVAYVELDSEVRIMEEDPVPKIEKDAPWGLARISHREPLGFSTFNKYPYAERAGEGVDVYIVDTGTNIEHVDFEGRAKWGKTIPNGDEDVDGNGHGSHCSGTVGGAKFGVAKKANIYAVKVLRSNGSGTMSDVVKGVEYVAEQHIKKSEEAKKGKHPGFKGSAANMSLGGGKSAALDMAVNAAVEAGVHFAVAAGNDNADACRYSPAAADRPITVGASTLADERAYFSNYGKCVDIFAPGFNIRSTWIGSKYATNQISGTSMASPHVAGLLAYFLSLQPAADSSFGVPTITPQQLKKSILSVATEDALSDVSSSTPNLLAWTGGGNSNFGEIVKQGGYKIKKVEEKEKTHYHSKLPALPSSSELLEQVDKMSEKIADAVFDRLANALKNY